MLNKKALAGTAGAAKEYVEDVFSTYLYTGNGSTQTITNGIDLAGKGGLVWCKNRSNSSTNNILTATPGKALVSNTTNAETTTTRIDSFNSDGFFINNSSTDINQADRIYVSWTFRKAQKFFDVVTYTGNGANRTIEHNLGSVPGMIIVKRTDASPSNWMVYHRNLTSATYYLNLNSSAVQDVSATTWNSTAPTSTVFSLGNDANVNSSGGTYVAYLFAHDAGGFGDAGTDNIISCGSYVGSGSAGKEITLGYEPQFVLIKNLDFDGSWFIFDNMRGIADGKNSVGVGVDPSLLPNSSNAETASNYLRLTANGFILETGADGVNNSPYNYIYMAIRRPMKVPTSGSQVFSPTVYTGTNADNRLIDTGILTDMVMIKERNDTVAGMVIGDRLRGQQYLLTGSTAAEVDDADSFDRQIVSTTEYGTAFSSHTGVYVGNDATAKVNIDTTSNNHIAWAFKRARGFFDIVCYTGTGSATTITHNLGAVPELLIVRRRAVTGNWLTYNQTTGNTKALSLNADTTGDTATAYWNDTTPTSSVFTVGTGATNTNTNTYVAYLFASLDGICKIGSYTGNGTTSSTTQNINCGFTNGARFVLIKNTTNSGNWVVFDTARGITTSSNDPFIYINTGIAEGTTFNFIEADSNGFTVRGQSSDINTNGDTYIYLAIA